ncbi:dimethyl sulfoxide reductase anchor subunit family protein [Afifella pfennigii]|uniref:dimethyl sulfoxide reductase anchor subunit family protein n=1 Tax=Afifella pfennigii TaxID=209897 RepID=UPI00047E8287|nr:DmsC/YnfH family molybdoenzyme membrane anchor subunit [Afifella pfennigii]
MHPAFSVIFFTTATGAGYGLLALTGVFFALGTVPQGRLFGFLALGLALVLITGGLLSSALHLGRPERAPRAFTQWRTSWLSREAVASVATYVPAAVFGIGWVVFASRHGIVASAGLLSALGALITLLTTGMIYASLKPIPEWSSPYTLPGYILFALMTGAVILNALLLLTGAEANPVRFLAPLLILAGWAFKTASWRHNDALKMPADAASATGLSGSVRSVEWPHTQANYLMKEMGYRVARKHAAKLRLFVHLAAFALPFALTLLAALSGGAFALVAACLAALIQAPGILTERWLFFAEARHTVMLYYGR